MKPTAITMASDPLVIRVHPKKGVVFIGGKFKVRDYRRELIQNDKLR